LFSPEGILFLFVTQKISTHEESPRNRRISSNCFILQHLHLPNLQQERR